MKWAKLYYAVPIAVFIAVLALFGVSDYSDIHKAVRRAVTEAETAEKKAQAAESKADAAGVHADAAEKKIQLITDEANKQLKAVKNVTQTIATVGTLESDVQSLKNRVSALQNAVGLTSQNSTPAPQKCEAEVHINEPPFNTQSKRTVLDFGEQKVGTYSNAKEFGASCTQFGGETKLLFTLKGLGPFHFKEGQIKQSGGDQTLLHTVYGGSPSHVLIWFAPTQEGPVSETLVVSSPDGSKFTPSFENPLKLTGIGKK